MSADAYEKYINDLYAKDPQAALKDITYARGHYLKAVGERQAIDRAVNTSGAFAEYQKQNPDSNDPNANVMSKC